ncbi:MAG: toll/interleukin-1 receptor domain-containing protein [Gammaproteobacteria bacterium]|nr:toll/interleukin-1 receptor domain-containing protein [Gammaproteobacteria bacterium]
MGEVAALLQEGRSLKHAGVPIRNYIGWRNRAARLQPAMAQAGLDPFRLSVHELEHDLSLLEELLALNDPGEAQSEAAADPAERAPFRIFVSHKMADDEALAGRLMRRLQSLSRQRVKVLRAQEIPGAADWQRWVEENVRSADMLLFLHTADSRDDRWLLYEAGLYRGSRDDRIHLVCLKNPNLSQPPPQLSRLQSYDATREGISRFCQDLLYEGTFTDGEKLNERLFSEQKADFEEAVDELVQAFSELEISTSYFRMRLEMGPIPSGHGGQLLQERLATTPVACNDATRALLGLPEGELQWAEVGAQFGERAPPWMGQMTDVIDKIETRRFFSQVLAPFETANGRKCYPVVSRIERLRERPRAVTIIFVEAEAENDAQAGRLALDRTPAPFATVIAMLDFARRFRWHVLSRYISELTGLGANTLDMSSKAEEIRLAVEQIEAEAAAEGFLDQAHVLVNFPGRLKAQVAALFETYTTQRQTLADALHGADREAIVACLRSIESTNKRFLRMALSRYAALVEELPPDDLGELPDRDPPALFASSLSSDRV